MKRIIYLFIPLVLLIYSCDKEIIEPQEVRQAQLLSDYLAPSYKVYREQTDTSDVFYFNNALFLEFLAQFGNPSPNVFDYYGSGAVNTQDMLQTLAGFGDIYPTEWDIYNATIVFQASSGWQINLDGWSVCFLKVTPWDEQPPGSFIPDELRSFVLEGVLNDGTFTKVWYYRL